MFKKGWQPENYKGVHDEIKQQHMKAKDMTFKGRLDYFWYYYKVHTLVAVCIFIFGGTLIRDIVTAKDYGFYSIMLNSSLLNSEAIEESFGGYAEIDTDNYSCYVDTQSQLSYHSQNSYDYAAYQKLIAQIQTHELDVIVADAEVFKNFATGEMFFDLREFMSPEELSEYEGRIYYIDMKEVRRAQEETDRILSGDPSEDTDSENPESVSSESSPSPEETEAALNPFGQTDYEEIYRLAADEAETHRHPEDMTEPVPMGIFLDGSPFMEKTGSYGVMVPIFGAVATGEKTDLVKKYLTYLWDETIPFEQMISVY